MPRDIGWSKVASLVGTGRAQAYGQKPQGSSRNWKATGGVSACIRLNISSGEQLSYLLSDEGLQNRAKETSSTCHVGIFLEFWRE
jgi:hypothetical protein